MIEKRQARLRRARQTRHKIAELGAVRLLVHRSNGHIYAQVIDAGAKVVAYASTLEADVRKQVGNGGNVKAAAMIGNDVPQAQRILKQHLMTVPTDVPAIRMLAEVAVRCGREEDAEKLLLRCLDLAPSFAAARYNYAILLHRRNDSTGDFFEV